VVTAARLLHLVQDDVEGDLLLVQEHELLAHPDLVGRDAQQLLTRCHAGVQEQIGVRRAIRGRQSAPQEVEEMAPVLAGEQLTQLIARIVEDRRDLGIASVVQVRRTSERVRLIVE
jgi:hypothetical protein